MRNAFDRVKEALVNYINIFTAAEAKISESFSTSQFAIDSSHKPFRLHVTNNNGGLLVYVMSYLPLSQLTKHKISSDIEVFAFEINLRKEKWFS